MSARQILPRIDAATATLVRHVPAALLIGLCVFGAWRITGWIWRIAPTPAVDTRIVEPGSASLIGARHWFGVAAAVTPLPSDKPLGAAQSAAATEIKLLGLIGGGKKTIAMFRIDKDTYEVALGEVFAQGLKFRSYGADFVVIEKQGAEIRVALPFSASVEPSPTDASAALPQGHSRPPPYSPNNRRPPLKASRP